MQSDNGRKGADLHGGAILELGTHQLCTLLIVLRPLQLRSILSSCGE